MAHGLVFAGIGADLGAILSHLTQAHPPRLPAEPQHLNKQPGQDIQVPAAAVTDPAVVRLLIAAQHAGGGVFPTGLFNLAGAGKPDAIGVQAQLHHHPGVVGLLTPRVLLLVDGVAPLKIQLAGQIEQEEHQVVFRQPVHW